MATKDNILDNVMQYSSEQLARHIADGTVTLDELKGTGDLSASLRKEIESLLVKWAEEKKKAAEAALHAEESAWQSVRNSDTIPPLTQFLTNYPQSTHASEARSRISELKKKEAAQAQVAQAANAWNYLDKTDINALREFVQNNPGDPHLQEARTLINKLIAESRKGNGPRLVAHAIAEGNNALNPSLRIQELLTQYHNAKRITTADILSVINNDKNILKAEVVKSLCVRGLIGYDELEHDAAIDSRVIDALIQFDASSIPNLPSAAPPNEIAQGYTEVYFWGIPSSGKTCALGSIMSAASKGVAANALRPEDCQGYGYMTKLSDLFTPNVVCALPSRNAVEDTYEMRFNLVDGKKREHKLAFIDMAGELLTCLYKVKSNLTLSSEQANAMVVLDNILVNNKTHNRKIHFFVIEYGAEGRNVSIDGGLTLKQDALLQVAVSYIAEKGIFDKDTDGIYLIVTKSDKSNRSEDDLVAHIKNYVQQNYKGLYGTLKEICQKKEINGGEVGGFPFSIGDVYFQNLCVFDPDWTVDIIEEIKQRSYAPRGGVCGKLTNVFNN